MEKDRRDFMKRAGLAGLSVAGASLLPSCNQSKGAESSTVTEDKPANINDKNWPMDPEGQKAKYGSWGAVPHWPVWER